MTIETLQPADWAKPKGYTNGFSCTGTEWITVGGQIGWNAQCVFETDDFVGQVKQTLQNILTVLAEADAGPEHIVRLTWYITDKQAYTSSLREMGRAYREVMGRHFPPMAVVQVVELMEDEAKVEIEATAIK